MGYKAHLEIAMFRLRVLGDMGQSHWDWYGKIMKNNLVKNMKS